MPGDTESGRTAARAGVRGASAGTDAPSSPGDATRPQAADGTPPDAADDARARAGGSFCAEPSRLPGGWRCAAALWTAGLATVIALGVFGDRGTAPSADPDQPPATGVAIAAVTAVAAVADHPSGTVPSTALGAPVVADTAASRPPGRTPRFDAFAGDPVTARNSATRAFLDGIASETAFGWTAIRVFNDAGDDALFDGVDLVEASPQIQLLATTIVPMDVAGASDLEPFDPLAYALDHPLSGSSLGPSAMPGWTDGAWIVLLLSVPDPGDYRVRSVRLRYRLGGDAFSTEQQASLEVCAGAVVGTAGDPCPWLFAPSPARWAHTSRPA